MPKYLKTPLVKLIGRLSMSNNVREKTLFDKIFLYMGLLVLFISVNFFVDIYLSFVQLQENNLLLAYLYIGFYVAAVTWIAYYVVGFYREYKKYDIVDENLQNDYKDWKVQDYPSSERKIEIVKKIASLLSNSDSLDSTDRVKCKDMMDIKELYREKDELDVLLDKINKKAKDIIVEDAVAVGVMTSVAQKTSLDMLIVLVKNISLMRKLLRVYGYKPSTVKTMYLMKKVIENIAAAGAIENADEIFETVTDAGAGLAGMVAGGIANALMMRRVGNECIRLLSLKDPGKVDIKNVAGKLLSKTGGALSKLADKFLGNAKEVL